MLEIPNGSIKQTSKTTLEGAEETYLSGKLVLEGDLTERAADALGCLGAIRDSLPAFTIPKTRLKEGEADPHGHLRRRDEQGGVGFPRRSSFIHRHAQGIAGGRSRAVADGL